MFKSTVLKHAIFIALCGVTLVLPAHADTWQIDIDTTSLAGIGGYLDLQFNPGASDAQALQAQISNFSGDAVLGTGLVDGAVSGSLSGVLMLDNSDALNAWLQGLVFGSHIAFTLDVNAAPVTGSGSSFAALLWDADFNPLLAAAGEDAALRVDLLPGTAPSWVTSSSVQVSAVPEPAIMASLLAGLGMVGLAVRRRKPGREAG